MIEGEISSREFFEALLSQTDALEEAFGRTAATIPQAFGVLRDSLALTVGSMDALVGGSSAVASALLFVADNMDRLVAAAGAAAVVLGSRYAISAARAAAVTVTLSGAIVALRRAIASIRVGLLIVGLGEAVVRFTDLARSVGGIGNAFDALGSVTQEAFGRIGTLGEGLAARFRASFFGITAVAVQAFADILQDGSAWANSLIGIGVGAGKAFVAAFQGVPAGIEAIMLTAANAVGGVVEGLLNGIVGRINDFTGSINGLLSGLPEWAGGGGTAIGALSEVSFADLGASARSEAVEAGRSVGEAFSEGLNGSYVEGSSSYLGEVAESLRSSSASARQASDALIEVGVRPLKSIQALRDAVKQAESELGEGSETAQALRDELDALGGGSGGGGSGSGGRSGGGAKGAAKELKKLGESASEAAFAMRDKLTEGIDVVSDAFGDFFASGLTDFKGFASDILGGFQRMLAQMVATATKNRILINLGFGVPGAAALQPGALGGGGLIGGAAAFGSSAIGGALGVGRGFLNGGLSGGFGAIGTALSGATSGLAGLGTAIGAIAGPAALAIGVFSAFRSKTKELDAGLQVTVSNMNTLVETFRKTETSRFFGLSKSRDTDRGAASRGVANPIEEAVAQIQRGILDSARVLGVGAKAFRGFTQSIEISTKDLTDDQIQREIEGALSGVSNAFAGMLGPLERFRRSGEELPDTLARLSSSLSGFNQAMDVFGESLAAGFGSADRASSIVDRVGGVDAFREAVAFYEREFLSLEDQVALARGRLRDSFGALGRNPRFSTGGFEGLAQTLADNREFEKLADLLSLGPAVKELQRLEEQLKGTGEEAGRAATDLAAVRRERSQLEERLLRLQGDTAALRGRELAGVDASNRSILRRIFSLEDEAAALKAAEAVSRERTRLEERILNLQGDTAELRRRELEALSPANRSLQEMIYRLEDAKAVFEDIVPEDFATRFDFQRARGRAAAGTAEVAGVTATGIPLGVVSGGGATGVVSPYDELMRQVRDLMLKVETNTYQTTRVLRGWDRNGQPEQRAS